MSSRGYQPRHFCGAHATSKSLSSGHLQGRETAHELAGSGMLGGAAGWWTMTIEFGNIDLHDIFQYDCTLLPHCLPLSRTRHRRWRKGRHTLDVGASALGVLRPLGHHTRQNADSGKRLSKLQSDNTGVLSTIASGAA